MFRSNMHVGYERLGARIDSLQLYTGFWQVVSQPCCVEAAPARIPVVRLYAHGLQTIGSRLYSYLARYGHYRIFAAIANAASGSNFTSHKRKRRQTMSPDLPENPDSDLEAAERLRSACSAAREQVAKAVVGQRNVVDQLLISMLARGHCLLEGVPGLAKTLLVRSFAQSMDLTFHRIQFTPDLMPVDITGTDIIQESSKTGSRELVFEPGPIFAQLVLADEINRTPPKTQAALLEAMQEHEVTVGGKTYPLAEPFFVLATQNPIEQEGTYPLPEAQRDRFLFQVKVDYPSRNDESAIIDRTTTDSPVSLQPVVSGEEIIQFQSLVRRVPLPDHVKQCVLDLVRHLRPTVDDSPDWVRQFVDWGPGPRACQQLVLASKARALLDGRHHVIEDDVLALALPVLRHRVVVSFAAEADGLSASDIVSRALDERRS